MANAKTVLAVGIASIVLISSGCASFDNDPDLLQIRLAKLRRELSQTKSELAEVKEAYYKTEDDLEKMGRELAAARKASKTLEHSLLSQLQSAKAQLKKMEGRLTLAEQQQQRDAADKANNQKIIDALKKSLDNLKAANKKLSDQIVELTSPQSQ